MLVHCKLTQVHMPRSSTIENDTVFGVTCQLPLLREEFVIPTLTFHSDLRRRAASHRALPCPSSFFLRFHCCGRHAIGHSPCIGPHSRCTVASNGVGTSCMPGSTCRCQNAQGSLLYMYSTYLQGCGICYSPSRAAAAALGDLTTGPVIRYCHSRISIPVEWRSSGGIIQ